MEQFIHEEIKKILGTDEYKEVKKFFRQVMEINTYEYKIAVTRRAYLLYNLFSQIISEEENITPKGQLFNSHSWSLIPFNEVNEEKRILIFDDIIVHGRTVLNIIEKIKRKSGNDENVYIWCIKCYQNARFYPDIKKYLKYRRVSTSTEWKLLSDKFTKLIASSDLGYVSYVKSFRIPESMYKDVLVSNNNKFKIDIYNNEWYVVWLDDIYSSISKLFNIRLCIRFYKKSICDNCYLAIPYVFLPSLNVETAYEYCTDILSIFSIEAPTINTHDHEDILLLCKWSVAAISQKILAQFIVEHNFSHNLIQEVMTCTESFKNYSLDSIQNIIDELIKNSNNKSCTDWVNESSNTSNNYYDEPVALNADIQECRNIFNSILHDVKSISQESDERIVEIAYQRFLGQMRKSSEENALHHKERLLGLQIFDIIDIISKSFNITQNNNTFINYIYELIIESWDIGTNSYNIVETNSTVNQKNLIISGILSHGEQAYKVYYEAYQDVYPFFYELFDRKLELRREKLFEFAQYFDAYFHTINRFRQFVENLDLSSYYSDLDAIGEKPSTQYMNPHERVQQYIKENY